MKKALVGLTVVVVCLETLLYIFADYTASLPEVSSTTTSETLEVVHPYLGYVHNPRVNPVANDLGLPGPQNGRILILGGSFAQGVAQQGGMSNIYNGAVGGYKQPQQLMVLNYLLSQGLTFDAVINIDGFNEVALPVAENIPQGTNPFYPRGWAARLSNDRAAVTQLGKIYTLQDARKLSSERFRYLRFSRILCLVWKVQDSRFEATINRESRRLISMPVASSYASTGPSDSGTNIYGRLVNHWAECSILMDQICKARGIRYIHMLQPNQYAEGTKSLSKDELKSAYRQDHPYRKGVENGYYKLVSAGRDLPVEFYDLTMIYKGVSETIYIDDCCHPNPDGYKMVAEYIERILKK